MKSKLGGKSTSEVEVTQISIGGIWVLIDDREFFLSFEIFPRFRSAIVSEIHNVQLLNNGNLNWPDLEIDVSLETIGEPEHVPEFTKTDLL